MLSLSDFILSCFFLTLLCTATQEAKSRLGLTTYRWDRVYVFIQAGNLLMQRKGEVVATLLMEIDKTH